MPCQVELASEMRPIPIVLTIMMQSSSC